MQAFASGVLKISFADFLGVIVGVHLLIGFIEGAITFTVVAYLRRVRPAVLGLAHAAGREVLSRKAVAISVIGTALLLGGVVSWFASVHPDGLEWSYMEHKYGDAQSAVGNRSQAVASVDAWQGRWALMSDYTRRPVPLGSEPAEEPEEQPTLAGLPTRPDLAGQADWPGVDGWGSLAGVLGTLVTLAVIYVAALAIRKAGSSPANKNT
jgi:cobalt/nickel transport system permease protein